MPIIGLQRRLRECGRIRLGEQRTSSKGKRYPASLPTFRFTSADRPAIDAVAEQWGGQVRQWQSPAGPQWEVTVDRDRIGVIVPPTDLALSQWLELWDAGGCKRRCDGSTETLSDGPCLCDPNARECQPTTRLSVIVPDLPAFGLWRLETHGYYAAVELAGVVDVANRLPVEFIEAVLRIDQRVVKRTDDKGEIVTQHFTVPVLDLGLTFRELLAPAASNPALPAADGAASGGTVAEGQAHSPSLTPVPNAPADEAPPAVSDQLDRLRHAQPRARRGPMPPPGGIDPETGEVLQPPPEPEPEPAPEPEGKGMAPPPASTTDPAVALKRVMAEASKTWPDLPPGERDNYRHALGVIATYTSRQAQGQPPVQSVNDMTLAERLHLSTLMAQVRQGQLVLRRLDDDAEGHQRWASQLKGGERVAHLKRLDAGSWDVNVTRTQPPAEGAQP